MEVEVTWPNFSNALSSEQPISSELQSQSEKHSKLKRLKLWEIQEPIHCSVVGTCASVDDIKNLAKKVGIRLLPDAPDYAVHGYLVEKTTHDTPFARAFQKLLDQRFQGAIRKVQKTNGKDELQELWSTMVDNGFIAAGYWALMTSGNVPSDTKELIYGDVHMYSHLAGSCFRRKSQEASLLQNRLNELEDRIKRNDRSFSDTLGARDQKIAEMQERIDQLEKQSAKSEQPDHRSGRDERVGRKLLKLERALVAARQRARHAEARSTELEHKLDQVKEKRRVRPFRPDNGSNATPDVNIDTDKSPIKILYVGGRRGQIRGLKSIAEKNTATLVHHDGGIEDMIGRLDPAVASVDCVMCPIDCVSHAACLRAKKLCVKSNIPFLPLRTSSQSALNAAILEVRAMSKLETATFAN
ncbi:MAG: DUF2325 domain-containing protein [Pseudomonadota bacterium]